MIIETSKPDARIVGGLLIYILPEHIWGKVPLKELTGAYQPDMPLVGSGPYIGHRVRARAGSLTHGAQPRVARGAAGLRRDPVHQVRHRRRGRARARPRRGRLHPGGPAGDLRPPRAAGGASRPCGAPTYAFSQLAFNLCSDRELPRGEVQPGGPGQDRAPGDRLLARPRADQRDLDPGHLLRRPRHAAVVLQVVLRGPGAGLPLRPRARQPVARRCGLGPQRRRRAREGRRGALVRPLRALGVARSRSRWRS